ncbi:MAG: CBS domain-containing protein [Candidatus Eisenbacteria bacterium]
MPRVSEILAGKDGQVHTLSADASVYAAVQRMVEHNIGSLVVLDDGEIAGIFTERDYLRRVSLPERPARLTPLRDVMTASIVCVGPDSSVQECMAMMTRERIRHLPVVRGAELVGVISIGDLVKYVSDEREVELRYLTGYIKGERV